MFAYESTDPREKNSNSSSALNEFRKQMFYWYHNAEKFPKAVPDRVILNIASVSEQAFQLISQFLPSSLKDFIGEKNSRMPLNNDS